MRCVQASATMTFDKGEQVEAREFEHLRQSATSKALRHLFFAERQAAKIPGLSKDVALRKISSVGVVGAGTMGGGIAMNFANAGIPVVMVEANDEALQRGLGLVRKNYEASAAKGKLNAQQLAQRLDLLKGSLDYSALAGCDLVIEAVFENMELKKKSVLGWVKSASPAPSSPPTRRPLMSICWPKPPAVQLTSSACIFSVLPM
ncbi:3-hydroxyacyl-CoA dehydrogenase NAD-binding domain-containing protein [Polaromonas sp. P2-4]|nr:3-hydroxyacyl-CoA dehydrogenase NAD-binding domain-containing protein [Polaromonas sp. P2-4]